MVLLHKQRHFTKRVQVRGHSGGSLTSITNMAGMLASKILGKVDLASVTKALGGLALGGLASYGVNKALNRLSPEGTEAMVKPPLTVGPVPQGTLRGDILPVKNSIQVIDPANHYIDLPDGKMKVSNVIVHQTPVSNVTVPQTPVRRRYGGKISPRKGIDKFLNNKSKDILNGLLGSKSGTGIYKM